MLNKKEAPCSEEVNEHMDLGIETWKCINSVYTVMQQYI